MLTTSELKQVKHYLELYSKKDSDLQSAETPLTGYEQLAILQDGVNKIVPLNEIRNTLILSVSPSIIFLGEDVNVAVIGTASPAADNMKILKGSTEIISGSGTIVSATDTINETTTYTIQASILGHNYTNNQIVTAVNPIYYGSGSNVSDFWEEGHKVKFDTPTTSPYRTYDVTVRNDEDKVYFAVPSSMEIHKTTMNGFDFPLDAPDTSISGYRIYPSSNTYDATDSDTLTIVIS